MSARRSWKRRHAGDGLCRNEAPAKQHITDERMAEHMQRLLLDSNAKEMHLNRHEHSTVQSFGADMQESSTMLPWKRDLCPSVYYQDMEEMVSSTSHKQRIPTIQMTPPTPVEDSLYSDEEVTIVLDEFPPDDCVQSDSFLLNDSLSSGSDSGADDENQVLTVAPEVKKKIDQNYRKMFTDSNGVLANPCLDVVLWQPREGFLESVVSKAEHLHNGSTTKSSEDCEELMEL